MYGGIFVYAEYVRVCEVTLQLTPWSYSTVEGTVYVATENI